MSPWEAGCGLHMPVGSQQLLQGYKDTSLFPVVCVVLSFVVLKKKSASWKWVCVVSCFQTFPLKYTYYASPGPLPIFLESSQLSPPHLPHSPIPSSTLLSTLRSQCHKDASAQLQARLTLLGGAGSCRDSKWRALSGHLCGGGKGDRGLWMWLATANMWHDCPWRGGLWSWPQKLSLTTVLGLPA